MAHTVKTLLEALEVMRAKGCGDYPVTLVNNNNGDRYEMYSDSPEVRTDMENDNTNTFGESLPVVHVALTIS